MMWLDDGVMVPMVESTKLLGESDWSDLPTACSNRNQPRKGITMGVNVMEIFEKRYPQKITTTALELEKAPADRSLLEDLMRSFHTLKGSARAIQFDAILEVAHAMEGLYHQLLDHDGTARPDLIELSLFATDIVKMLMGSDEKEAPHIFAQSIIKYQSGQPLTFRVNARLLRMGQVILAVSPRRFLFRLKTSSISPRPARQIQIPSTSSCG